MNYEFDFLEHKDTETRRREESVQKELYVSVSLCSIAVLLIDSNLHECQEERVWLEYCASVFGMELYAYVPLQ